ncbi:hypothetical protein Enr13x_59060 [Stieleria neptunia]|uniref:Uncharacterized protein n=1 Tax=Stieleria neptunia TaxID=2527979 RepID=A0A518HYT7_9BACT|nr:hypothetical protein Enr13x_59060 [Stieleria neptunia]
MAGRTHGSLAAFYPWVRSAIGGFIQIGNWGLPSGWRFQRRTAARRFESAIQVVGMHSMPYAVTTRSRYSGLIFKLRQRTS